MYALGDHVLEGCETWQVAFGINFGVDFHLKYKVSDINEGRIRFRRVDSFYLIVSGVNSCRTLLVIENRDI